MISKPSPRSSVRVKYSDEYNPIREYWDKIRSHEIVVCRKIYKQYEWLDRKLRGEVEPEYHYDPKRGNHILEFIENFCSPSKGAKANTPLQLMLWEKAMLAAVFGFVDDEGYRQCREMVFIVAKKNGKSALSSAIGLYLLIADQENGPEVYAVATKRDQAKIIWGEAKKMANKSRFISKMVKPYVGEIVCDMNQGSFKPLASDKDTLDGLNVSGVLMDEIHQWKGGAGLYDIMVDGTTARKQPLTAITTTAGTVREDFYDQKYEECKNQIAGYGLSNPDFYNPRMFPFVYELDERKEWTDERMWIKANPGLGVIKETQALADKVRLARQDATKEKNLLTKEFDIPETSTEAWLTMDECVNEATFDIDELKPRYGIGGVDLASTTDLTCATIIFRIDGRDELFVEQMYWLPENLIEKRVHEDRIPYDIWIKNGWMRTSGEIRVDYRDISAWFREMQEKHDIFLFSAGYDPWNSQYLIDDLKANFGKNTFVPVQQLKKTMSIPMKVLRSELGAHNVNYNNNPILRWCLTNSCIDVDKNDNIQLCKTGNAKRRIDGVAALIDAFVVYQNNYESYINLVRR